VSSGGAASPRLKALFFLRSIDYDHMFGSLLRAMLARGDEVLVATDHRRGRLPQARVDLFDDLGQRYPGFDHRLLRPRRDLWRIPASAVRRSLDYLPYLEADVEASEADGDEARDRAPRLLRILLFLPPFRWRPGRRVLGWVLRRFEPAMPIPRSVKSVIKEAAPDVVVVSPLAEFGLAQDDLIRTAEAARTPSVLVVVSWDDLATKGPIRDAPTMTVVSSQDQVNEAVRVRGLPRGRIEPVGAESFKGLDEPAPPGTVSAIEHAAATEVVPKRQGRLLRPVLWLLTPLLAIVLPLLRPRATVRAVIKAVKRLAKAVRRLVARARKRVRAWRRRRRRRRMERLREKGRARKDARREDKALAAMQKEERATARAARQAETARARAAKEEKARARAAKD
jgi:hypothetical protein